MVARVMWVALRGVAVALYTGCLWHSVNAHLLTYSICHGDSMLPTINACAPHRDVVLVASLTKHFGTFRRNDIIVAKQPDAASTYICKRIVAVEGDNVPPDLVKPCHYQTVPRGHVWVEGDNTSVSYDSREFGPLPLGLVEGQVILRVWPFAQFGTL